MNPQAPTSQYQDNLSIVVGARALGPRSSADVRVLTWSGLPSNGRVRGQCFVKTFMMTVVVDDHLGGALTLAKVML